MKNGNQSRKRKRRARNKEEKVHLIIKKKLKLDCCLKSIEKNDDKNWRLNFHRKRKKKIGLNLNLTF